MTDEHRKLTERIAETIKPYLFHTFDATSVVQNNVLPLLADEMRKVRLEEAKWWHKNMPHAYAKVRWCIKRITALSAPGTEEGVSKP